MTSSSTSSICRIDWRPSRLLQAALLALGLLAALSLWLSNLSWWAAIAAGAVAMVIAARAARNESLQPDCSITWQAGAKTANVNFATRTESWHSPKASFHGAIGVFSGVDEAGRRRRLLWWPDTLDARERRRFRLVASEAVHEKAPLPY